MTLPFKKIQRLNGLANWTMMVALFFNPFGFDIVQYWLILLTGDLWKANFVLYCIAGLFFGLSFYFRYRYKTRMNLVKIQVTDAEHS